MYRNFERSKKILLLTESILKHYNVRFLKSDIIYTKVITLPIQKLKMITPIVHMLNLMFLSQPVILDGAGGNYDGGHIYQVSVGEGL
jgi:hypothetical protein